jgi:hypothetical protein
MGNVLSPHDTGKQKFSSFFAAFDNEPTLESVELHIERVRSRVARANHDIPEGKMRERYGNSRWNLIHLLLPSLAELKLFDSTMESYPQASFWIEPKLLLHSHPGIIASSYDPVQMPAWARLILQIAIDYRRV